jgi:hypothetical protein
VDPEGRRPRPAHGPLAMSWLSDLRLIPLFNFYLAVFFLVSTFLRLRQYRTFLALVRTFPNRWPRLLRLVKQHKSVFLTWGTVLPLVLMLALIGVNWTAGTFLWPEATDFSLGQLFELWPAVPVVLTCGAGMVAFDVYGAFRVGRVDREQMEKYFDQAEYWLKSWAAPVVRVFTFGYINPRKMVAVEVRTALVSASKLINYNLWWMSIQTGLRIAYGLSLWGTYALEPWLRQLAHR